MKYFVIHIRETGCSVYEFDNEAGMEMQFNAIRNQNPKGRLYCAKELGVTLSTCGGDDEIEISGKSEL
jgi:hypothetical protein